MLQNVSTSVQKASPPTLVSDATEAASMLVAVLRQPVAATDSASSCSWAKSRAPSIRCWPPRIKSLLLSKWLGVFDHGRCRWSHIRVLQVYTRATKPRPPVHGTFRGIVSGSSGFTISIRCSKLCGLRNARLSPCRSNRHEHEICKKRLRFSARTERGTMEAWTKEERPHPVKYDWQNGAT